MLVKIKLATGEYVKFYTDEMRIENDDNKDKFMQILSGDGDYSFSIELPIIVIHENTT